MFTRSRRSLFVALVALALLAVPAVMLASHSWSTYHWARTSNPFTLKLGDNVSSAWDSYLSAASADWSVSTVLNTTVVAGGAGNVKRCTPTTGRVEVCNTTYGNTGWLGVAGVSVSGSHITKAYVKLNDTYFNTATYNTPSWRQMVTCQEIGHTFGLDHQDTVFDNPNLGTCMDYTSNPDGPPSNTQPNQHDFDQLSTIYTHLDSTTTVGQTTSNAPPAMSSIDMEGPGQWGKLVRQSADGRHSVYMQDFGGGNKVFTFVIWVGPRSNQGQ